MRSSFLPPDKRLGLAPAKPKGWERRINADGKQNILLLGLAGFFLDPFAHDRVGRPDDHHTLSGLKGAPNDIIIGLTRGDVPFPPHSPSSSFQRLRKRFHPRSILTG